MAFSAIEGALKLDIRTGIKLDGRSISPSDLNSIWCYAHKLGMSRQIEQFFHSLVHAIESSHGMDTALFESYLFPSLPFPSFFGSVIHSEWFIVCLGLAEMAILI